jgi:hypothetical protein
VGLRCLSAHLKVSPSASETTWVVLKVFVCLWGEWVVAFAPPVPSVGLCVPSAVWAPVFVGHWGAGVVHHGHEGSLLCVYLGRELNPHNVAPVYKTGCSDQLRTQVGVGGGLPHPLR